jgi:hypothetical protein
MSVVEALCYKAEVGGFNSRWGHWIVQLSECIQTRFGLRVWHKWIPSIFLGVKGGRLVRPTSSWPSVNRVSVKVGASTPRSPTGLHGLLHGYMFLQQDPKSITTGTRSQFSTSKFSSCMIKHVVLFKIVFMNARHCTHVGIYQGLGEEGHRDVTLTTWNPLSANVSTNFVDQAAVAGSV